jgi:diacylglycerol kinase (ATP)
VRILLIINGNKPEHQPALREQVERLRALGHEVRPCVTFEDGDARRMAEEGAAWGAELVLAAGGDGTINGVANGLHDFAKTGAAEIPRLGIVPMGTANDLANALEIPGDIAEAVTVALEGTAWPVAIATVNCHCFLNVSSGGIGAQATHDAPQESKRLLGPLAYAVTGVKKLIGLEAMHGGFSSAAGVIYDGPFLLYAVGNSVRTGGGNLLTPHADPTDPFLDLCIVKEVSRLEFTKLLPALRSGEHLDDPAVLYVKAAGFTVEAREEVAVNADGEPLPPSRSYQYELSRFRLPVVTRAAPQVSAGR